MRRSFLLGLILSLIFIASNCSDDDEKDEAVTPVTWTATQGASDCQSCHSTQYTNWSKHGHGYKLNKVDSSGSTFPTYYPYSDISAMLNNIVTFNDGEYDDGSGDTSKVVHDARTTQNTSFIIGGYGWKGRYIDETGRILHGDKAQYNLDGGAFVAYHDRTKAGDDDTALTNYNCGFCHTTGWKHKNDGGSGPNVMGLANMDGEFTNNGITCYRCHGTLAAPANTSDGKAGHNTKSMKANVYAAGQMDKGTSATDAGNAAGAYAFGQLTTASNNICSDCHNRGDTASTVQVSKQLIRHHEQSNELLVGRHGVADADMTDSKDANLTCMTCHDPHATTKYDSKLNNGEGVYASKIADGKCNVLCHNSNSSSDTDTLVNTSTSITVTSTYATNHTCVDCHMPYIVKSAQSFSTGVKTVTGVTALGTPSETRGDIRSHIFALTSTADANFMTESDGSTTAKHLDGSSAQVKTPVDYSCMTCHGAGGANGPTTAAEAATQLSSTAVH